ncbi:alpha/beta hydrolase family protein [Acinetobacter kyonggiensis]|uniref:Predicted alpha/beta hydrolase n=1 Tax=Acinetobacter kyonggiensis TaxID=595670 RepID=A0A1H3IUB8_9GAMM|nr:alpha/beta fold hydrolase [Acinetobacter kyonggiensis]SDY31147.1 Predicted alpha/beta hydrolase [Acinetobacter kyonggiensis]
MPNLNQNRQKQQFSVATQPFSASDGYALIGTLYTPEHGIKANIVLSSATGVPQAFYRRFAEYATQFGYQVLTFDYRGVALSAPKQLKGFKMSYLDWGALDLAAAIDFLAQDQIPLFMVGHSYGGQALGLAPNHAKVTAMYCFGTGAGWHGYMPFKEKMKVQVIWNIIFPPIVAVTGYLPWSKLNMGADLPIGVYQQWRKWCKNPTYFFADPEQHALIAQYAQVKTPIYAVSALDDDWALPNSRHAFMQHYSNAPMQFINISASDYGLKEIRHMGYFRKGSEKIWDEILHSFHDFIATKNG